MKNVFNLIGFKPYKKKNTDEISGYTCHFAKPEVENDKDEFGTQIKSCYISAYQLEQSGEELTLGDNYKLYFAFDSGKKCDVFAGFMKV